MTAITLNWAAPRFVQPALGLGHRTIILVGASQRIPAPTVRHPASCSLARGTVMALPETRLLETAVDLAEELHFSRAAERLHIDQSTVSTRLHDLEDQLGYLLFKRNHKTVELTEAGRKFVEEARIALLHTERAVQAGRAASRDAEVVLNIGRSPYTDPFLITTLLSIKLPLFPQLKIELSQQFSCDLIREVLAGGLDLAIATEPPKQNALRRSRSASRPFILRCRKKTNWRMRVQSLSTL